MAGEPFSAAGPATWNSLPVEIRQSATLTVFKSKLKTFLFTKSYPVNQLMCIFATYPHICICHLLFFRAKTDNVKEPCGD